MLDMTEIHVLMKPSFPEETFQVVSNSFELVKFR